MSKPKKYTTYEDSRFTDKIRISSVQKEWIRENLGSYKTLAGKLDAIINAYRDATMR